MNEANQQILTEGFDVRPSAGTRGVIRGSCCREESLGFTFKLNKNKMTKRHPADHSWHLPYIHTYIKISGDDCSTCA